MLVISLTKGVISSGTPHRQLATSLRHHYIEHLASHGEILSHNSPSQVTKHSSLLQPEILLIQQSKQTTIGYLICFITGTD